MSGVMEYAMELESYNLTSVPDKRLCVDHIDDGSIKQFIRQNYELDYCNYCEKRKKVIDLEDLMKHIMSFVNQEYTDARHEVMYVSAEGGYVANTMDNEDILSIIRLDIDDPVLSDDILFSIDDVAWVKTDFYGTTPYEDLIFDWRWFKETIQHKQRFVFIGKKSKASSDVLRTKATLEYFGSIVNKFNLVKKLSVNTKLYRCRATTKRKYYRDKVELITPPDSLAKFSNRFSPSGVGMFYAAFDEKTATLETISPNSKRNIYTSIGEFKNNSELNILDLTELPQLHSFFSLKKGKKSYERNFLHHLVGDMSRGVKKDGMEHIDYVPTQVVTEYLRYVFKDKTATGLDGIIYPSSKNWKSKAIVIFTDHRESNELFDFISVNNERLSSRSKYP